MKRLVSTIIFCFALLPLIPLKTHIACSSSTPLYTHFVYMFGHASFLHWLVNSWSLLVLHNLFRPARLITAYTLSVAISFLPPMGSVGQGVIGMSVMVCFFIGFLARYIYSRSRLSFLATVALMALTCVLPGFAGAFHIIMFVMGFLYFHLEGFLIRLKNYCTHD